MPGPALCWCLLCVLACLPQTDAPLPLLRAGDTLSGRLADGLTTIEGHGLAREYRFEPGSDGLVTLSLSSYDFDAFIRVEELDGGRVREDDDSGIESNAMLVIRARRGKRYRVYLGASGSGKGLYSVTCATGRVPLPYGAERDECVIHHWAECASRAVERGDQRAAARHTLRLGDKLSSCARYGPALEALQEARDLAVAAGDREVEVLVQYKLGFCHFGRGAAAAARASFLEHVRLARAYEQPAEELLGQRMLCDFYRRERDDAALVAALTRRVALARTVNDAGELELVLDELIEYHRNAHQPAKLRPCVAERLRLAEASDEDEQERLQWMVTLARAEEALGDHESAGTGARQAVALARRLEDREREAALQRVLAAVHEAVGQDRLRQAAVERLEELRAHGREEMEPWVQAAAAVALLELVEAGIPVATSRSELADELLELTHDISSDRTRIRALRVKGMLHARAGNHDAARRLLEEALDLAGSESYRYEERRLAAALAELPAPESEELPE